MNTLPVGFLVFSNRNRRMQVYMPRDSRASAAKVRRAAFGILAASVLLASVLGPFAAGVAKGYYEVIAVEASTGRLLWRYRPWRFGPSFFEMYSAGLVVFPGEPRFLDPNTGNPIKPFDLESSKCLARSFSPYGRKIRLDNGWERSQTSMGDARSLWFTEGATGKPVWKIQKRSWNSGVDLWKNFVFCAYGWNDDEAVLDTYEAGAAKPTWTVDLNQIVTGREKPLSRIHIQVMDDTLYALAMECVFAFDPKGGKLLWHRDLAKDLRLRFIPDFFRHGSPRAVFAKSQDFLVVSFQRRVVALDTRTMKYLWHMEPDTWENTTYPLIYEGKVFLRSGDERRIFQAVPDGPPQQGQPGQTFRELDWHDAPLVKEEQPPWKQLLDAIEKDDFKKAHLAIEAGADVNIQDADGTTALHALARRHVDRDEVVGQQLSLFRHLVKAGARIDAGIETGKTPLVAAIMSSNQRLALELIEAGASVDTAIETGKTPLVAAIMSFNERLALQLIKAGAKVTYRKGVASPLHCVFASSALVRALIVAGADVNAQDDRGQTPLHHTVLLGESDKETYRIITMLAEAGGDLSAKDKEGRDPIEFARYYWNETAKIADFMESLKKDAKPKPPNPAVQPAPSPVSPADSPDPAHVP